MTWDTVKEALMHPVTLFSDPTQRLAIPWMICALIAALGVYVYTQRKRGEPIVTGLIDWLLPRDVLTHPSAKADYAMFVLNKSVILLIYASIFVQSTVWHGAIMALMGPVAPAELSLWASAITILVTLLAFDFALWFGHYLFHKVPFLWEFHKSHHSAEVMTPITAVRMHPVDELFSATLASFAVGAATALTTQAFGEGAAATGLFGMNILLFVFYAAAFNLRHSHVWLPYPAWLSHVFVSPAQHQIHHSQARHHWDKNMGFIFAFWDWMAGTLYAPKEKEDITFGLGNGEDGTWNSLKALYFRPFRNAALLFRKGWRAALISDLSEDQKLSDSKEPDLEPEKAL